jgi:hypothetical protein
MATAAQIIANRANAQSSTGPVTAEGKFRASHNAVTSGLFSKGDFVRPGEEDAYAAFCASYEIDLAPAGAIEHTLAAEIIHAAWRLRRCSAIEAEADEQSLEKNQQSVERARAAAHRAFHRSVSELRRLQTERHIRGKVANDDIEPLGLASSREIAAAGEPPPASDEEIFRQLLRLPPRRTEITKETQITKQSQIIPEDCTTDFAKQSQSEPAQAPQIARGARCPCGSGVKYKRCCGKDAPPVLNNAI